MTANVVGLRLLAEPRVRRAAVVLVVAIVVVFRLIQLVAFSTQIQWGYDFSAYWQAARNLLDGLPIYAADQLAGPYAPQRQFLYLYPPPLAAAVIPLAAAVPDAYRVAAWTWAALGGFIVAGVVLVVGRREGLFETDRFGGMFAGRRRWIAVGLAFTLPPVIGELVLGNVHVLLLGLLAIAWLGVRDGSPRGEMTAGLAVGLASIVKIFPALIVVWFLLSGRHRAAAWAAVSVIAAAALALPLTGIQPWLDYPTVLSNLSAPSDTTDTLAPTVWLAPILGFTVARIVVTVAAFGLVTWAAIRRPAPLAFAATIVASLLIAPALYHHYLAILILPFLLAASALRGRGGWLLVAYLLLWGGTQPALGDLAWVVNRAMPTLGALTLFAALVAGSRSADGSAADVRPAGTNG